jgi:hypothetical protein
MFGFLRDSVRQALLYVEMLQRAAPFNPLLPPPDWLRAFLPESFARRTPEVDVNSLLARIAELERRLDEFRHTGEGRRKKPGGRERPPDDGKE